MNKKFIWILAVILIIIASGVFYFLYKQQPSQVNIQNNTTYPQISNFTFYPIHEIKLNKLNSGTYNTEGYVVKIYTCPPCPKGAQCKPCMRDNIVISENNKLLETYSLSDKEMILFVNSPKQFELGKKYTFSIKILDYKSTSEPINDVEIIGYNSLLQNTLATPPTIAGTWIHAYEEDTENNLVYRNSETYTPPPSRFRHYFIFKENNICSSLQLAPDDAHYLKDVNCGLTTEGKITFLNLENEKYLVINQSESRLVLQKLDKNTSVQNL